jgi:hypothetical protein
MAVGMHEMYGAAFEAAQIDDEAMHLMSTEELRMLLPSAPLGHLLKLKQALASHSALIHAPPGAPSMRFRSKFISSGGSEGCVRENAVAIFDVILVTGTLLLAIAVGFTFDLPVGCENGSACETLRRADIFYWTLSTSLFAISVITALLAVTAVLAPR